MWKDIKGFEGHYQASIFGEIKSLQRTVNHSIYGLMIVQEKLLTPNKTKKGYLRVNLSLKGKSNLYQLHRIIADTFLPNPDLKMQVNHINGIKTDNMLENLEWATNDENRAHAKSLNLIKNGLDLPQTKLHDGLFEKIMSERISGKPLTQIAKDFNVAYSTLTAFLALRLPKGGLKKIDPSLPSKVIWSK